MDQSPVDQNPVDQPTGPLHGRPTAARWPLVALLIATALVGGCTREFGGENQRQAQSTSLSDVREKVDLIQHDHCAHGDPGATYKACGGRYLRELQNAVQVAGGQAQKQPGGERVVALSQSITGRIGQFHQAGCDTPASDPATCGGHLSSINSDLKQLDGALAALVPGDHH